MSASGVYLSVISLLSWPPPLPSPFPSPSWQISLIRLLTRLHPLMALNTMASRASAALSLALQPPAASFVPSPATPVPPQVHWYSSALVHWRSAFKAPSKCDPPEALAQRHCTPLTDHAVPLQVHPCTATETHACASWNPGHCGVKVDGSRSGGVSRSLVSLPLQLTRLTCP